MSKNDGFYQVPHACLYIYATWADWLNAVRGCLTMDDRRRMLADIVRQWNSHRSQPERQVIVTLSARTALDLFLQVQNYPAGSHVLMSAINIPDVSVVVRHHNLVPVPIDIEVDTVAPKLEALEKARTPKTVALLLAHIYGRRMDMQPYVDFARKHNLALIEDAAEIFTGFEYTGHKDSDLAFFSFGSIKVATAFGGAVSRVKDETVWRKMQSRQDKYTHVRRIEYFKKCIKNSLPMVLLNVPLVTGEGMKVTRFFGIDHKAYVVKMLRGFPDKMMERIRQQPSTPLLRQMAHRFMTFDKKDYNINTQKGNMVTELLKDANCKVPGLKAAERNYWLYPILVDNPDYAIAELNKHGVDAYRGATQLALVPPPSELKEQVSDFPVDAKYVMDHVIYLPVHRNVPEADLHRLAEVCVRVLGTRKAADAADDLAGTLASGKAPTPQIRSKL